MKEITTKSGKLLLVKVPELTFYFDWAYCQKNYDFKNNPRIKIYWETKDDRVGGIITNFITANQFEILGKFSELKDEDFKEFVLQWGQDMSKDIINSVVLGFSDIIKVDENGLYYKDYLDNINNNYTLTVKESFQSLVKSQGLDDDLNNYLIIKVL